MDDAVNVYTKDAILLPPLNKRVDGRARIKGYWKGAIDRGISDMTLKTINVERDGKSAYEVGTFLMKRFEKNGSSRKINGKYVVVWRCGEDGSWHWHIDIWNVD